ncbi:MAG: hypothetical protein HYW05_04215 [Candidatus Diapherotrites archaeon]|nr:hypothetical protein [Candidatus Diapherotrites archaeon]
MAAFSGADASGLFFTGIILAVVVILVIVAGIAFFIWYALRAHKKAADLQDNPENEELAPAETQGPEQLMTHKFHHRKFGFHRIGGLSRHRAHSHRMHSGRN